MLNDDRDREMADDTALHLLHVNHQCSDDCAECADEEEWGETYDFLDQLAAIPPSPLRGIA